MTQILDLRSKDKTTARNIFGELKKDNLKE